MGLSAGRLRRSTASCLVVGHELQAQRLAGLLQQHLAAAVALAAPPPRGRRGATTASMGRASRNSSSSTFSEVVEAAEGEHQPRALAADGHAGEAHQQLERHLRPQSRGRRAARSRGSKGRRRASAWRAGLVASAAAGPGASSHAAHLPSQLPARGMSPFSPNITVTSGSPGRVRVAQEEGRGARPLDADGVGAVAVPVADDAGRRPWLAELRSRRARRPCCVAQVEGGFWRAEDAHGRGAVAVPVADHGHVALLAEGHA